MSHLIDTELVRGNRKGAREEEGAKGRQNVEKKSSVKACLCTCTRQNMSVCVHAHAGCVSTRRVCREIEDCVRCSWPPQFQV